MRVRRTQFIKTLIILMQWTLNICWFCQEITSIRWITIKCYGHIKQKKAALTVAVIDVPWDEASRFGIMNTDENNRIIEFEEKPEHPKSNHASMGIYIFNWQRLRSVLINGFTKEVPMIDFGKNVIPFYIKSGDNVFAHNFSGYWKDVGTIQSLWEANMEFIDDQGGLNVRDRSWRIFF